MNRILLEASEIDAEGRAVLRGHRAEHILRVLRAVPGQRIKTGVIDGLAGFSTVTAIAPDGTVTLTIWHTEAAPEPWFDLLLAAPRPKVLKRLWAQLVALGAARIFILNAAKVEKDYFGSQWTEPEAYRPLLVEGLTQAGTTRLPEVHVCERFKPFMEDEFGGLFARQPLRFIAHPGPRAFVRGEIPPPSSRPVLAVGPEGGWTDYELDTFRGHGFQPFSLGGRPLRTDTACIALIAVLQDRLGL